MTYQIPMALMNRINERPFYLPEGVGDSRCQACFGENPVWWVENEIWNAVMDDEGGVLCPSCFMIVADARGSVDSALIWKISVRR